MKIAQKYEESVGAVIVRRLQSLMRSEVVADDDVCDRQFLLLKGRKGDWNFTKGHKEICESDNDTIRREIFEETGITLYRILAYIGKIKYSFTSRNIYEIKKQVKFYYVVTTTYKIVLSNEHIDYAWLGYGQVNAAINIQSI